MKKFLVLWFAVIILLLMGGCQSLGILFDREPEIISEPVIFAMQDSLYSYLLEAMDPDGDLLVYSFDLCPEGMKIDGKSGLITWFPLNSQVGFQQVIVKVYDGKKSVFQNFEIEVENLNDSPQIIYCYPENPNPVINDKDTIKFTVKAKDIDPDAVLNCQWYLDNILMSDGVNSLKKTSYFESDWIYSFCETENREKYLVKAIISDGLSSDSEEWILTVKDITAPEQPNLNSIISPTKDPNLVLAGGKEENTSIWINGVQAIPIDGSKDWCYPYNLKEGVNNISITSRDFSGNESIAVIGEIELDTVAPMTPAFNELISPTNVSPAMLSGTKEINTSLWLNGEEVVAIDNNVSWQYMFNLVEGFNDISITSYDVAGNESQSLVEQIEYNLNVFVDEKNISGIEDGTEKHPFNTINEGIKLVPSGKSVKVKAGNYNEQLIINKGVALKGENKNNTFITGNGMMGSSVTIDAENVQLSGFCIDGGNSTDIGVCIENHSNIVINDNTIRNYKDYGIKCTDALVDICHNHIANHGTSGIEFRGESYGRADNNSLIGNKYGIRTCGKAWPEITGNLISNNSHSGIYCRENATPSISNNMIKENGYGIFIDCNALWGDQVDPDVGGGNRGSIGRNSIFGNSVHGLSNKTCHQIFAKNNWWGDAFGPKYPYHASGNGDWVYWSETDGTVQFTPYLISCPDL